jgi:sporulation protein YlmC with PRC-barrel domain
MTVHAFHDSLVKRLLDHQVVDRDGRLLGKVDDLALREDGDGLVVEGLLIGPGALAPRYPGVLGRWGWAIWRRLNHPDDPGVVLVPWREITDLGSAIQVVDRAGAELLASFGLERWLRRHLIGRIPGAKGDGDQFDDDSPWTGGRHGPIPQRGSDGDVHRMTELFAMVVIDEGHESGRHITDLEARTAFVGSGPRLTRVLVGPRVVGSSLGYSSDEQDGPRVIRWIIDAVHREAHWHDVADLAEISWSQGQVRLRGEAGGHGHG